jgi:hypothetical protein
MRLEHQKAGKATHPVDIGEALLFCGVGHQLNRASESPRPTRKSKFFPERVHAPVKSSA